LSDAGGCAIGTRPLIFSSWRWSGSAEIEIDAGYVTRARTRAAGGGEMLSQGDGRRHHTALMAAALANGTTLIEERGRASPKSRTWPTASTRGGARINGAGTSRIRSRA